MNKIRCIVSIFLLFCSPVLAENEDHDLLNNAIKQVSSDLNSIRSEARKYLESGRPVVEPQEDVAVLARRVALDYFENNKRSSFDFLPVKKSDREVVIKQALTDNDTKALIRLSEEILESRREKIVDEAKSVLEDLADGKETPCGSQTTTTITNGKKVTKEEVAIAEVESLKRLRIEYCRITADLEKLSAGR